MRFINDDVKLKKGGRKAVRISEQELWNKMVKRAFAVDEDGLDEEMDDPYDMNNEDNYMVIQTLFSNDDTIDKDIKIETDAENYTMDPYEAYGNNIKGKPLVGFHTLENGFTFVGVELGGDGEYPFFTAFYFDGKKVRCYTPSYGNPINLDAKCALGGEYWTNTDKLKAKYKKLGIDIDSIKAKYEKCNADIEETGESEYEDECDYMDGDDDINWYDDYKWYIIYCEKYGLKWSQVGYNWDAIKEDIMSRIEVV